MSDPTPADVGALGTDTAVTSVVAMLDLRIKSGDLRHDPAQHSVALALDQVVENLVTTPKRSLLARLKGPAPVPRGLYIHGGVGRGKTMLMDMFHSCLCARSLTTKNAASKILSGGQFRLHFHDFMVLAQDLIHNAREAGKDDAVESAAEELAKRGRVMCFDEMEVRDIADAMILQRLFTSLFNRGIVVIATSNRHADDLYKNGLHRDRFLPFIEVLKSRCQMMAIAAGQDWRAEMLADLPSWYCPADAAARQALNDVFARLSADAAVGEDTVRVASREIVFESVAGDVARADFSTLCETPLGARDFLAIAGRFAGLIVDNVPAFSDTSEASARRFMWLVDALYDRQRFLIASAETDIANLYDGHLFAFEFDRTKSRLGEMTRRYG